MPRGVMLESLMESLSVNMETWNVPLMLLRPVLFTTSPICKLHEAYNLYLINGCLYRTAFWPFLYCMYSHGERQNPSIAQQCATQFNMDWGKISTCYLGEMGHELELMYYNETASLNPPHQYTPWVTINGKVCACMRMLLNNVCCVRSMIERLKATD